MIDFGPRYQVDLNTALSKAELIVTFSHFYIRSFPIEARNALRSDNMCCRVRRRRGGAPLGELRSEIASAAAPERLSFILADIQERTTRGAR